MSAVPVPMRDSAFMCPYMPVIQEGEKWKRKEGRKKWRRK
jgi:hypothetical protein